MLFFDQQIGISLQRQQNHLDQHRPAEGDDDEGNHRVSRHDQMSLDQAPGTELRDVGQNVADKYDVGEVADILWRPDDIFINQRIKNPIGEKKCHVRDDQYGSQARLSTLQHHEEQSDQRRENG